MKELELITSAWDRLRQDGQSAVLATVVKTSGSAYRSPGARLLITGSGERFGSVSGGCLEDDLIKRAWWLTEARRPVLKRYDTTSDGDVAPAFGLGCNGVVHVLIERLESATPNILTVIRQVRNTRQRAVVEHCLTPGDNLGKYSIMPDGTGTHAHVETANTEHFIEVLDPPIRVLIVGAGSDAVPVTELCRHLGWPVTVLDGRAHYARAERFPASTEVLRKTGDPAQLRSKVDSRTAVVLMSHSYSQDCAALRDLSGVELPYLGVLGPRKRTDQLLADALSPGSSIPAQLHSPIGLDIGADSPEQVALAMVAEIQAAFNRRGGGALRDKVGPIHARPGGEAESVADYASAVTYCDLAS